LKKRHWAVDFVRGRPAPRQGIETGLLVTMPAPVGAGLPNMPSPTTLFVKRSISKKEERKAMPLYPYRCETCGTFTVMRRVAERDEACACPTCSAIAQRMLAMPALAFMSSTVRAERQVSERAVYTHQHGAGCGCGSGARSSVQSSAESPAG
jgi:putative FmdB family regulatory protein